MNHKSIRIIIGLLLLLLLVACSGQESPVDQEPIDDLDFGNIVSASGKVMPVRWAEIGFESGGRLTTIVEEGSEAKSASELAQVESVDLQQAVLQADANLAVAEAQLALSLASAREEDLSAASGGVEVALGRVTAAKGGLEQTRSNSTTAIKTAEAQLAHAQAEANRAYAELALLQDGARPEEIAALQARVNQLQSEFLIAENIHFDGFIDKDIGGGPEERARYARESARNARDAAQAELDLANAGSNSRAIAAASSGVAAAQAQVAVAEAALEQAQATTADVTVAQAQVQIATGELAQAQANYDKLANGGTPSEIAVLEAEVARAKAALSQAEAALSKAKIIAPFSGVVGNVLYKTGEVVTSGVPVLVLGDTSSLRVETTDLNEVDAAQVGIGSTVTLTFDALPGITTQGEIVRISPMASAGQGGTNFTAVIEMSDPPEALRWGMTAFVDIDVE
jgi:multidrug efflux pump subunit AcrA (membrane-fusion protein)